MAAKYPLSPAMWRFVEHSRAFASDSPRLDAQRAAYARMCQAFAPPRPAGLRVLDSCLPAAPPVRVRRYRPDRPAPPGGWPALLYLHGGGWMLGGLGLARWSLIWLPALCVAGGLLVLLGLGRALNALMAGEQTAVTLGLDARRVRLWVFICCSLLTGVLVSVSGAIGFVGLMLPHAARLLVGAEHRRLLPVCALLGALFLVWMDVAARTLIAPQDLPIGIATAAIGGLFFILLLRRRS